jgi:hypothetical protein
MAVRVRILTFRRRNRTVAQHEVAHGFIFYPGEAKKPKELRINIRTVDTRQVYPLILKF